MTSGSAVDLPCQAWSFCVKRCRHKWRTPKRGACTVRVMT